MLYEFLLEKKSKDMLDNGALLECHAEAEDSSFSDPQLMTLVPSNTLPFALEVKDLKSKLASQEAELQLRNQDAEALIAKTGFQTLKVSLERAIADTEEQKVNLTEVKAFTSLPMAVIGVTAAVTVLQPYKGKVPKDQSWKATNIFMGKVYFELEPKYSALAQANAGLAAATEKLEIVRKKLLMSTA
ncbi:dynein axonemal heavy chain 11 [Guaruba guarouba]